jgi:hypothetical protein
MGRSQLMQRNFRPPVLTIIKCIGLLHLQQAGGGEFFGMTQQTHSDRKLPGTVDNGCSVLPFWRLSVRYRTREKNYCVPVRVTPGQICLRDRLHPGLSKQLSSSQGEAVQAWLKSKRQAEAVQAL